MKKIGLDIGSTTIKCVVLDENNKMLYSDYRRHFSHIKENIITTLKKLLDEKLIDEENYVSISGSAGMGFSEKVGIPFVQEVYGTRVAANNLIPGTDCIIELGGEDAKILFLTEGLEVRMNGTCAGGTGAFIDQMATLLNVDISDMNGLAEKAEKLYPIASRCGVFAKTDIQPLLNQGAPKTDIAASIFKAVVNQTIGGLAQGREIKGKVAYLGGPLTFIPELRKSFNESLNVEGVCPENSLFYVSIGAALCSTDVINIKDTIHRIETLENKGTYAFNAPLFNNEQELKEFRERHAKAHIDVLPMEGYDGNLYLGIDSGSTTLKFLLIDEDEQIRFERYLPNKGNPVKLIKEIFEEIYTKYPNIKIKASASTGYGEELAKNAFSLDAGLVETMAHYEAASKFKPNVDFIIDIGGQDIKCFKIENKVISNIFLNEACSSGCGSFFQTFANALGYEVEEFAKLGLEADKPVDLGSRCTVFMNSSVKQAQKDGASIQNISAGLSISVVKNALYKVIRTASAESLGKNIVVQGGTFHNEAVLRAFEKELKLEVVRPNISGLMGAYGAALYAKRLNLEETSTITKEGIKNFKHTVNTIVCNGCTNHCKLSVNTFGANNNRFISGNKCEKPVTKKVSNDDTNMYEYIRNKLLSYQSKPGKNGKIGLPLVLSNYDLLPFWHTLFTELDFEVVNSGFSSDDIYILGQNSIPSDTICYPAKLVHGHIEKLISEGIDLIYYPCMSYNINEEKGDNYFNCPIVAYYPQTIRNNLKNIQSIRFIRRFIGINDPKQCVDKILEVFSDFKLKKKDVVNAVDKAYLAYQEYHEDLHRKADEIIKKANEENKQIIVLAGRPYHVDPQVNHGIDKLISGFDVAVITEESIAHLVDKFKVGVLNQWTYHTRLYAAAKYCTTKDNMNLVQLVSFGCGLDAVTTDECKSILENKGKIYTQIKIDEITNLGAVKIRLRSLFAALNQKEGK